MTKVYVAVDAQHARIEYRDRKRWWWLLSVVFHLLPFAGMAAHAATGSPFEESTSEYRERGGLLKGGRARGATARRAKPGRSSPSVARTMTFRACCPVTPMQARSTRRYARWPPG